MRTRLLLSTAALLGTSGCMLPGSVRPATADLAIPSDPCPADPGTALAGASGAAPPDALPQDARSGSIDALAVGVALIRSASPENRDARAADPTTRYVLGVEDSLGMDLSVLEDHIDMVDEEGAQLAEAALRSDALTGIVPASTESRSAAPETMTLSRAKWADFSRTVYRTTAREGWTAAFARSLGELATGTSRAGDGRAAATDLRKKYLVAAYMAAYFRNGAIVSLSVDTAGLKDQLMAKLKAKVKDEQAVKAAEAEIDKLASDLANQVCKDGAAEKGKCVVLGAIGEQTFVTRAGKSYGFPGISVAFGPTATKKVSTNKIAEEDIAPDLVRVVLEAVGDELFHVPGSPNSTLCGFNPAYCGSVAQAAALAKVNDAGDRAEATATGTVGTLVRGGWILSLNNETLARTVTTGVAVSLRKAAEGAMWRRLGTCTAGRSTGGLYRSVTLAVTK